MQVERFVCECSALLIFNLIAGLLIFFLLLSFAGIGFSIVFLCIFILFGLFVISVRLSESSRTLTLSELREEEADGGYTNLRMVILMPAEVSTVMPEWSAEGSGSAVVGMPLWVDPSPGNNSQVKIYVSEDGASVYEDADLVYGSSIYLSAPPNPEGDASTHAGHGLEGQPRMARSPSIEAETHPIGNAQDAPLTPRIVGTRQNTGKRRVEVKVFPTSG
ncbi:unnamed protein product [Phytomonas sp. EM1]|nr:unnamed protein product [Phytomonas sp. EM1]|eukprot:CCW65603.1 unnamed protein product [Phytomonas sp. isolate EM1]